MVASCYHFNHIKNLNLILISIKERIRPIGVVEAHEPVEFGGQLRILDRVPDD